MADEPNSSSSELSFDGSISKGRVGQFGPPDSVKLTPGENGAPHQFRVRDQEIGSSSVHQLNAVIAVTSDSKAFISFANPLVSNRKSLVTVVLTKGGVRPTGEVDGVWVAEEGGRPDDDDDGTGLGTL